MWGFDQELDFMGKAFGLFVDMDTMLGGDFEKGLNNLEPIVEADARARVEAERVAAEQAALAASVADPGVAAAPPQ